MLYYSDMLVGERKRRIFLPVQLSVPGRVVPEVLVAAYDFNHVSIMQGPRIKLNFTANVTLSAKESPMGLYLQTVRESRDLR
jgi:hypothetical protein